MVDPYVPPEISVSDVMVAVAFFEMSKSGTNGADEASNAIGAVLRTCTGNLDMKVILD
ncbi:hypothetical protein L861_17235 [Litchfieldella anticariensis FP35 = DSM 16096]|uniref:Uncharacterized protein n=1 Tax=Litchfieldella anticariensis (strain DSM 16096 / CECT 5854 / CIP 108499 / LMG 22089 / FP35) TaxID=1121939 RepID=S2LEY4_LITA3|nr:hypothetical protein L861_17235 [Halomonas anticariensis FP35 = DSM 16096]